MAESRPISVRAPRKVHERIEAAAARAGVTKSVWVLTAIEVQLDQDEDAIHEPAVITAARPRFSGARVLLPQARIPTR